MDIYLIRHTTTATPKGLCYGQTDVPLADNFAEDFSIVRNKLPGLSPDCRVISSPLTRCLHLANDLSHTVNIDQRLLEINFGQWEGQLFDDIEPDRLKYWADNFVNIAPPGGESFTQLRERVNDFWQDLITNPHEQVAIISHAGVIRALFSLLLDMPPALAFRFQVDYGSISKIRCLNNYPVIQFCNR